MVSAQLLHGYCCKLQEIRDYLVRYDDRRWPGILTAWIRELDAPLSDDALSAHVSRSMKACAGMGSLGDVVIAPDNGHRVPIDPLAISSASRGLWTMTEQLYDLALQLRSSLGVETRGVRPS